MAGAAFCCLFCCMAVTCLIFGLFFGMSVYGYFWSFVYYSTWTIFYYCAIIGYYCLFAFMIRKTHSLGIQIMRLKQENKNLFKSDKLQSNWSLMIMIIVGNLILISGSILLANYVESRYIKFPLIIYVCFIFGYVAAYPLSEKNMNNNESMISHEIALKTPANTTILLLMYVTYSFYS